MKLKKLIPFVEEVETFDDAWDALQEVFQSRSRDFEFIKKGDKWLCKVYKVTKVMDGKEVKYKKAFELKEEGDSIVSSFKKASLTYLKNV